MAAIGAGGDVVLLSPTGSGKTLAFLLPLLHAIDRSEKRTQAMIVVPSRELALQIDDVWRAMRTGLKCTVCYGGHKREIEEQNLVEAPALIIGTPGRLGDHLRRGSIGVESIRTLVLDEFDKSLEAGFEEEVAFVVTSLTGLTGRVLTSATAMKTYPEWLGMDSAQILRFLPEDITTGSLGMDVRVVHSPDKDKLDTLLSLIASTGGRSAIVFLNHRDAVARTAGYLRDAGIGAGHYHGGMEQRDREAALAKFRNGSTPILVTTDLAARGLDVPNIRYIIHYHLPDTEATWTHRNGRTARMDASGTAVLVLAPGEVLPKYAGAAVSEITLPADTQIPPKPEWQTLRIAAGKKDKINKVDIVGFLTKVCGLKKEDVGLIEVKDFLSFAALRRGRMAHVVHTAQSARIKGARINMEPA